MQANHIAYHLICESRQTDDTKANGGLSVVNMTKKRGGGRGRQWKVIKPNTAHR